MKLSVVIPNYNGQKLIKKNLPSVIRACRHSKFKRNQWQVIIVDDASTDNSVSFIQKNYPRVKLIRHQINQGFARSINLGVNTAQGEIIVLLNTDVEPFKNTFRPLEKMFLKDGKLFSIGFLEITPQGKRGKSHGWWQKGLVVHRPADLKAGPTFWTFAASAAYRKSMWQTLGGLDPLFRPAYWEDIDLSYRAQKAGWKTIFAPQCQVRHWPESTMKKVLGPKTKIYSFKNQLLFVWKNISDFSLILSHRLWLPYHLIVTSFRTKGQFLLGFLLAILQIPELIMARCLARKHWRVKDKKILNQTL